MHGRPHLYRPANCVRARPVCTSVCVQSGPPPLSLCVFGQSGVARVVGCACFY